MLHPAVPPCISALHIHVWRQLYATGVRRHDASLRALGEPEKGVLGRSLDDYIEAQVHGDIDLSTDVEMLVADPSYQGTPIGDQLEQVCSKYGIRLAWHPGFQLDVEDVPDDFRGPAIPAFARRVERFATVRGKLDAATIGRAAASFHYEPERWQDWAEPDVIFQHFKQLWHVLVRFG